MKNLLFFCIFIGLLSSCSKPKTITSQKPVLADSLFALKDLSDIDICNTFYDQDNQLFIDKSRKIEFVELDSTYKLLILSSILKKDLKVDDNYLNHYMISHFISKQSKIGDLQPIIVKTIGDDYSSILLIILDSNLKVISHFYLSGGFDAGPTEINDSISSWGEEKHSKIQGDVINSYVIRTLVWTDSRNDTAFIDSVRYKTRILKSGEFQTHKVDSIRYISKI
jgi:hypothetical protein